MIVRACHASLWIFLAGILPAQQPNTAPDLDGTRGALEQWVETKRLISKEKRDLALAKETLNQRIALVEREITSLREKKSEAEGSIAEADKKRDELDAENAKLKDAAGSLADVVVEMESGLRELLPSLPNPLGERIKPLTQRLPEAGAETKMSLSERFQNVVGIINEIDKFNREITVVSEVRGFPDGNSLEVTTLYLGLGHAYYVGGGGKVAGIGTPSAEGWKWQPDNNIAEAVTQAIAIINNEQVAGYVPLPVNIQ